MLLSMTKQSVLISLFCVICVASCTKEPQTISVKGVTLNSANLSLTVGETVDLIATVSPKSANNQAVIWSSSDGSVASVTGGGRVIALKAGTATITVKTDDGEFTASCSVTVLSKVFEVSSVSLSKSEIKLTIGESLPIVATILPENATDRTVIWSSKNNEIASVSETGVVSGISCGETIVTAFCSGKSSSCIVNVEPIMVQSIEFTQTTLSLIEGYSAALDLIIIPENASNKSIIWGSSDESIATVKNGTIYANRKGTAVISAELDGLKALCYVTVIKETDPIAQYLTITALDAGILKLGWIDKVNSNIEKSPHIFSRPATSGSHRFEFSLDKGLTWETVSSVEIAYLSKGDVIMFRGDNRYLNSSLSSIFHFYSESAVDVSGNIMSLVKSSGFYDLNSIPEEKCFQYLFCGLKIRSAKELVLPATELTPYCYKCLFYGNTLLTEPPALPESSLAEWSYYRMFENCTSLINPPALPSRNLAKGCYSCMFSGCTNLKTTPDLPALSLSESCYHSMFAGCRGLTKVKSLPATTLARGCYSRMFERCTSLKNPPTLPAMTLAILCYEYMFWGCINLERAPDLPALYLESDVDYQHMFEGCSQLKYVKAMFISVKGISGVFNLNHWLLDVANNGTFVMNVDAKWNPSNEYIVPKGWKIERSVN